MHDWVVAFEAALAGCLGPVHEGVAVVTWPINAEEQRRDLTERGIDGMTIDSPEVLRCVIGDAAAT